MVESPETGIRKRKNHRMPKVARGARRRRRREARKRERTRRAANRDGRMA
jgi:hypothetical protein